MSTSNAFGADAVYGTWSANAGTWSPGTAYYSYGTSLLSDVADGPGTPYQLTFNKDGNAELGKVRLNAAGTPYTFTASWIPRVQIPADYSGAARNTTMTIGAALSGVFDFTWVQNMNWTGSAWAHSQVIDLDLFGESYSWIGQFTPTVDFNQDPRMGFWLKWSRVDGTATLRITYPDSSAPSGETYWQTVIGSLNPTLTAGPYTDWTAKYGLYSPTTNETYRIAIGSPLGYFNAPTLFDKPVNPVACGTVDASGLVPGEAATAMVQLSPWASVTDLNALVESDCTDCTCDGTCGAAPAGLGVRGVSVEFCGAVPC